MSDGSDEHAFSLIELVVASAIAGILGLAIFGFFREGLALWQRGAEAIDAGEAAIGLEVVARAIRASSRDPEGIRLLTRTEEGARNDTLLLRSVDAPTAGGLPMSEEWVAFVHDPGRHELRRVTLSSAEDLAAPPRSGGQLIARFVSSLAVKWDGDRIAVTMSVEREGKTLTLRTSVRPRNW